MEEIEPLPLPDLSAILPLIRDEQRRLDLLLFGEAFVDGTGARLSPEEVWLRMPARSAPLPIPWFDVTKAWPL
jgi:hypothetical protein